MTINSQSNNDWWSGKLFPITAVILLVVLLSSCKYQPDVIGVLKELEAVESTSASSADNSTEIVVLTDDSLNNSLSLEAFPPYSGEASVEVNGGEPSFSPDDLQRESFETYSALDSLGRCGPAYALIGPETMPHTKRESIGMIKPSGWQIAQYDWIDGRYLYNRCHLIAFSLAGENDNELNLITGTRTMNAVGMLNYEEQVANYVRETNNHVLYRVTPMFEGDNLIASGVLMEAESVEDAGKGICFCVWCYNVEPGVVIDYATGNNMIGNPKIQTYDDGAEDHEHDRVDVELSVENLADEQNQEVVQSYVLNTNSHKFHYPDCPSVNDILEKNKSLVDSKRSSLIDEGFDPCGYCNP
ncbi:MAG: DNA/RNA non-specific endonuclease [Atopobiaceae bacterium]|nr:DNA/RNA non-specific endonuclease [Atopobiaceae bacterium]